jgi:syntaxin-binding protein 1
VDETSKKIIDNAVKEDDILNINVASACSTAIPQNRQSSADLSIHAAIERIEDRREPNPEMDAIYILSPEPHIVECLLADFEARRYRSGYLVWTNLIDGTLRRKIDDFPGIRQLRASSKTLFIDFYPRESHLVTFRDPWSFPMLYHPACNGLVPKHMQNLAQKVDIPL